MKTCIADRAKRPRWPCYAGCTSNECKDFRRCCSTLAAGKEIDAGIGGAGKFERYFGLFRRRLMPLVHSRSRIDRLLRGGDPAERQRFYQQHWNTWRWRLLFKLFFSRFVMGRMGRDPSFFRYVEGSVAEHILKHTHYALTALDPADNPYLHWILKGTHGAALPYALREAQFELIRDRIDSERRFGHEDQGTG